MVREQDGEDVYKAVRTARATRQEQNAATEGERLKVTESDYGSSTSGRYEDGCSWTRTLNKTHCSLA